MDADRSQKPIEETPLNNHKEAWWMPSLRIFLHTSAWISFPIIIALYIGDRLDAQYGTQQKYLFISIAVAFFVSMSGLTVYTIREIKKIKNIHTRHKTNGGDNSPEDSA